MKYTLALLVCLSCGVVFAADPTPPFTITLSGADNPVAVGELVDLQVVGPEDTPENVISVGYQWIFLPEPSKLVTFPGNERVLFGSGATPHSMTVIVVASFVVAVAADKPTVTQHLTMVQKDVSVVAASDLPTPTPTPIQPTQPTQPTVTPVDSELSIGAIQWVTNLSMDESTRFKGATALAAAYRSVAARITSGQLTDPSQILAQTKAATTKAVGDTRPWQSYFQRMADKLGELEKRGSLKTPQQYATVWLQIAKGLDTFK